jgi:phage-related protein
MEVTRKPPHFVGSSHDDLQAFPDEARRDGGFNLDFVQRGLEPSNWNPMGPLVLESMKYVCGMPQGPFA